MNDGGRKVLSCKPDNYESDIESESYSFLARNTFYLMNNLLMGFWRLSASLEICSSGKSSIIFFQLMMLSC